MPSLAKMKKDLEFYFSYSLEQIITTPTRTTDSTGTLIDHALSNSSHVSQFSVIDLGLSDHNVMYCARRKVRPKIS